MKSRLLGNLLVASLLLALFFSNILRTGLNISRVVASTTTSAWALRFDGSSGYVSVGSGAAVSQVTIEAWINSAGFANNMRYEIVSKVRQLGAPTFQTWGYRMYIDTDGVGGKVLTFRFGDGSVAPYGEKIIWAVYPFLTNTWYHVVGSFDGTNNGVGSPIYVNGVRQTTTESGTSLSGNSITYSTGATLRIGARSPESDPNYPGGDYNWWNGTIDEVRVYNRALTGAEVLAHYNSGFGQYGFPESGLAAGWHFDEGSGTVANDYSGNNNQGTTYYGVTWVPGHVAVANTLIIDPSTVTKTPGDVGGTFTVSVKVLDVSDLYGFDIKITWNNALITFSSLDNSSLTAIWPLGDFQPLPEPGYETGAGYVRYAAVDTPSPPDMPGFTGFGTLFNITFHIEQGCNFPLSTAISFDTVKLSDSHSNAITPTLSDGTYNMSATVPDLEFDLVNPNTNKPFEYCKYIEVQVYVTHICAHLTDYNLTVNYNSELLKFIGVDQWGVLGAGHNSSTSPGIVNVWSDPSSTPYVGDKGLLFNLTFHVEFDQSIGHVWRTSNSGPLAAQISLDATTGDLGFQEGTIPVSGVTTTSTSLTLTINLIQGDVTCDGRVNIQDLRTVAYYYDQAAGPGSLPEKYDLKTDGTIDIFDLVVIAVKFGYYYADTKP
jgi:hypothetical protein